MKELLTALRQTSQPLGPMGLEWLARQERALKRETIDAPTVLYVEDDHNDVLLLRRAWRRSVWRIRCRR